MMLYVELLRRCYSRLRSEMHESSPSNGLWSQEEVAKLLEDRLDDIVAEEIPAELNSYMELVSDRADELLGDTPQDIEVWVTSSNIHSTTPQDIINMNIHDLIWEDIQQIFEEAY
jgi:ferritin-like protein